MPPKPKTKPAAKKKLGPATPISWFQSEMTAFIHERNWHKFHTPRNLAASISIEAAELLEHFQWLSPEDAISRLANDPAFKHAIAEEFADVFMYLISLANALQLNIPQTVADKMAKNRKKYPAETYQGWYERPARTPRGTAAPKKPS